MTICLIYARSLNYCIGSDGHIPWRLPDDFRHFKATTAGGAVIMGRKTYEDHECAFPGRLNIVVSRNPDYQVVEGVELVESLDAAIDLARQRGKPVFIIGGAAFFEQGFALADTVYETLVRAAVEGDTFVPAFDFSGWQTECLQQHPADDNHAYRFDVLRHSRVGDK